MHKMPSRPIQHIQEQRSFAILLFKLREIGIFRDQTVNDYGIDFELELIDENHLTGRFIKVQVKARSSVTCNDDGTISVSGIKQSTLFYWAEMSFSAPVVIAIVDTTSHDIFISNPIFWQCIESLDATNSTKTLHIPSEILGEKNNLECAIDSIQKIGLLSSVRDELSLASHAMKMFKSYCDLLVDVCHYDFHMPVDETDVLEDLFETCSKLNIENITLEKKSDLSSEMICNIYNIKWWCQNYNFEYFGYIEGPPNATMKEPLRFLLPRLLEYLKKYRSQILKSGSYWLQRMPTVLYKSFRWNYAKATNDEDLKKIGNKQFEDYDYARYEYEYLKAVNSGGNVDKYIF